MGDQDRDAAAVEAASTAAMRSWTSMSGSPFATVRVGSDQSIPAATAQVSS